MRDAAAPAFGAGEAGGRFRALVVRRGDVARPVAVAAAHNTSLEVPRVVPGTGNVRTIRACQLKFTRAQEPISAQGNLSRPAKLLAGHVVHSLESAAAALGSSAAVDA